MRNPSPSEGANAAVSLDAVRARLQAGMVALAWVHVAIAAGIALSVGSDLQVALLAAGSLAVLATLAPRLTEPAVARALLVIALQGQAATFVGLLAGSPWQIDAHMYFFALMGIAVMLVDIGVLLAGAATVAVHHLAFNFLAAHLVYPGGADLGRTVLHAVILLTETLALIMAVAFIQRLLQTVAASQDAIRIELERSQAAQARLEEMEREARDRRRTMMSTLQSAFGGVVDAAVDGDFSKRAPTDFDDPELNQVAEGLNRLVATTDAGISDADASLRRLANGDLRLCEGTRFKGRFADLQQGVRATAAQLSTLVAEIQSLSSEMQRSTESIARDSSELANRAESQASSLEQTAATMEEMSATIKTNSDSAAQATDAATEASRCAERGGLVVRETVEAIKRIESESGRISEIIAVIDGIAFQTNLLALNAAVEAARAGDAGKGFAVVASEVRGLAQRSADAARDIKSLITTSATQVQTGVSLVERTGGALNEIVDAVAQVAGRVHEISAATREQASGVNEIAAAVSYMDEMTQQNATMADESASAAQKLAGQAEHLARLVSVFHTDAVAERPVPEAETDVERGTGTTAEAQADRDWAQLAAPATPAKAPTARTARGGAGAGADDRWAEF